MSKQDDKRRRVRYTLEFKLEAVRLVKGGKDTAVTARVLDISKASLGKGSGRPKAVNCKGLASGRSVPSRWSWPGGVDKERVQRLMKLHGIRARGKRKLSNG